MDKMYRKNKFVSFIKKYGYLFLIGLAFAVIVVMMVVSTVVSSRRSNVPNIQETGATTITYGLPVLNASVLLDYSDKELAYNATLKKWSAHKSIDFQVASGSEVYSIADGIVEKIYTNSLEGTVIQIRHANNLLSEYASLSDTVAVKKGDTVTKGQVIGTASDSAMSESHAGAHLHFTMYEGDKKVDPNGYLSISNK